MQYQGPCKHNNSCNQWGRALCRVLHVTLVLTSDSSVVNSSTCCLLVLPFASSLASLIHSCLLLFLVVVELADKLPTFHILALGFSLHILCSRSLSTILCLLGPLVCNPLLPSLSPAQRCQQAGCTAYKVCSAHTRGQPMIVHVRSLAACKHDFSTSVKVGYAYCCIRTVWNRPNRSMP